MLTQDFVIVDVNSPSWSAVRPFVEAALRLEQGEDGSSSWHGWDRRQIEGFLQGLPSPCSLLVAVWDTEGAGRGEDEEQGASSEEQSAREVLALGCVCEVVGGEVRSVRTFESLQDEDLPPLEELEPGYEHALALMRVVRRLVAPVAWGLFTDRQTWNEWVLQDCPSGNDSVGVDKGKLLAELALQGRCVLMGSQTSHHHP